MRNRRFAARITTAIAVAAMAVIPAGAAVAAPAGTTDIIQCSTPAGIQSAAANNKYVSTEMSYGGDYEDLLRARATVQGPWELFTFCRNYDQNYWYIVSKANNKKVSVELAYGGAFEDLLRARSTVIGPWEKFNLYCSTDGYLAIQSQANGKYVSADLNAQGDFNGMLRATAPTRDWWEHFRAPICGNGSILV